MNIFVWIIALLGVGALVAIGGTLLWTAVYSGVKERSSVGWWPLAFAALVVVIAVYNFA